MRQSSHTYTYCLIGLMAILVLVALALKSHNAFGRSNPTSQTSLRIALGKQLFNDPQLSADSTIRCASCHVPEKAYTDGRPVAIGVYGRTGTRNTPSLATINASKADAFFWDGRRAALEQAVLDPLTNPVEMGLHSQAELIQKIEQNVEYRNAFAQAFPDIKSVITTHEVATVLVAYLRSLKSPESAYDRYVLQGDPTELSPRARLGLAIFKGKGHCAECHLLQGSPPTLTDHAYHRTGVGLDAVNANLPTLTQAIIERSLQGAAIGDRVATHADEAQLGRFNVTQNPADIGLFRTPSLRGVASTAPYMHDGSVATLDDAIDREVYYRSLQTGYPLNLTVEEHQDLKVFLQAL
ncbi:cytochrome c551 peroxidase [Dyella lipolytica]|uniref:Cytochrome c family protein n=1 Tax=Dyella lipolytica TaxID=1867835 RepID=A0ABW8IY71_9GAMM|nr:cytochrome c551 peroxidase [Dyella lipolytica]